LGVFYPNNKKTKKNVKKGLPMWSQSL